MPERFVIGMSCLYFYHYLSAFILPIDSTWLLYRLIGPTCPCRREIWLFLVSRAIELAVRFTFNICERIGIEILRGTHPPGSHSIIHHIYYSLKRPRQGETRQHKRRTQGPQRTLDCDTKTQYPACLQTSLFPHRSSPPTDIVQKVDVASRELASIAYIAVTVVDRSRQGKSEFSGQWA